MTFTYRIADRNALERKWNKNIEENEGDVRWSKWKDEFIRNNECGRYTTFMVFCENEPIGEGTIIWSPGCRAINGRTQLADGCKIANINALRIDKPYEGQGHISTLVKAMEIHAKGIGFERLTIGVEARETRNLAIYLHWGYCNYVLRELEDNDLVLYYEKRL